MRWLKLQTHHRLWCHVISCCLHFLDQKSCAWTHQKDYSQRLTSTMFSTYMRGNNSPYQQVAVVCIHHSKRKTERAWTADIPTINKAVLAYHFYTNLTRHRWISVFLTSSFAPFSSVHWLAKLNSQSKWSLSDSTCTTSWKIHQQGSK